MSKETAVNFSNATLEQLRCSICMGYLSCSPVSVLPNGSCICGRCSPTNSDTPVYRVTPLEVVLNQTSFPCQFKERGCTQTVLFDQAADHESKCAYRSFACPTLTSCPWEGFTTQMHEHFREQHPEFIKENAEFILKLNEDTQQVFLVVKDDVVFIVKYCYNVYENCLKYDVRYFINASKNDGVFKIQLINAADSECNINLKTSKCLLYDGTFYDIQSSVALNLNKLVETLDDPISIVVVMHLKVVKSCNDSVNQETKVVNYELLESVRCKKCKNYLVPPLFDVNPVGTVCCNCAKSYINLPLSSNTKLVKLVTEMNFPCQWRDCSFVGKSDTIQGHNLSCPFRQYRCFIPECTTFMLLTTVAQHLQNHGGSEYLPNGIYKTSLSNSYDEKFVYTIKNGTLITIKHRVNPINRNESTRKHIVCVLSDLIEFTVAIQFEHQHCKLKSEPFTLVSNKIKQIAQSDLPFCFKNEDELSVVIGECEWNTTKT